MDMGHQITYDYSNDITEHGLYGGCWRTPGVQTLAGGQWVQYGPPDKQFQEDGKTYGTYDGETGVTLFNLRNDSSKPGCLMRKSRLPVDLSQLSKIEMDLKSSGSTGAAPWYSVWLAPMVYADRDDNAKAAEIDMVENYDQQHRGQDVNSVNSNFAQCGDLPYTLPYCQSSGWGAVATSLNHHVTVSAAEQGSEGRVINVYRCPQDATGSVTTCPDSSLHSSIKVTKPGPANVPKEKWFKIWNKDVAKDLYAHYFIVIDMWWTSGTDFKLSADNIKFFKNDGSEWKMPLDDPPPPTPAPGTPAPSMRSVNKKSQADIAV
jgi:hypothetical protein